MSDHAGRHLLDFRRRAIFPAAEHRDSLLQQRGDVWLPAVRYGRTGDSLLLGSARRRQRLARRTPSRRRPPFAIAFRRSGSLMRRPSRRSLCAKCAAHARPVAAALLFCDADDVMGEGYLESMGRRPGTASSSSPVGTIFSQTEHILACRTPGAATARDRNKAWPAVTVIPRCRTPAPAGWGSRDRARGGRTGST